MSDNLHGVRIALKLRCIRNVSCILNDPCDYRYKFIIIREKGFWLKS